MAVVAVGMGVHVAQRIAQGCLVADRDKLSVCRADQMVGTVAYMAPERFSSEPGTPLTAAADVFSWGCVIAYAGSGQNTRGRPVR